MIRPSDAPHSPLVNELMPLDTCPRVCKSEKATSCSLSQELRTSNRTAGGGGRFTSHPFYAQLQMTHSSYLGQIAAPDCLLCNPSLRLFPWTEGRGDGGGTGDGPHCEGTSGTHLMSFHKAADAPSNSINSLAPTHRLRLNPHQNDIRDCSGLFLKKLYLNLCNVFADRPRLPVLAVHILPV